MTADELRRWQRVMDLTQQKAALRLGITLSGYKKRALGQVPITRETALACAALAVGLQPWSANHGIKRGTGVKDV